MTTRRRFLSLAAGSAAGSAAVGASASAEDASPIRSAAFADRASASGADLGVDIGALELREGERLLRYVRSEDCDALVTNGGDVRWAPEGPATPAHWGAAQAVDETERLNDMIRWAAAAGRPVRWPSGGEYRFKTLSIGGKGSGGGAVDWSVEGAGECVLRSIKKQVDKRSYAADYAVRFSHDWRGYRALAADLDVGADEVVLNDASPRVRPGDLLHFRSTRMIQTDNRGQAVEGFATRAREVFANGRVALADPAPVALKAAARRAGRIRDVVGEREWILPDAFDGPERDMLLKVTLTSGPAKGEARFVTEWDRAVRRARFGGSQRPWPPGVRAGTGFEIEWTTRVGVSTPIHVHLSGGLKIARAPTFDAKPGDLGFRGLVIEGAASPTIRIAGVEDFAETALTLTGCHEPLVEGGRYAGANRAYDVFNGTGYGLAVNECWRPVIRNVTTARCRRGIDLGGFRYQSWYGRVVGCRASGGGRAYDGERFFPFGPTQNGGFGTHGAGFRTEYANCEASDVEFGFNCRARGERLLNCRQFGAGESCILVHYGGGLSVDGFEYKDGETEIGEADAHYQIGPARTPRTFMEIRTPVALETLPISLTDISCTGLRQSVIELAWKGAPPPPLTVGDVRVIARPAPDRPFLFIDAQGTKPIAGYVDLGGNRISLDGDDPLDAAYFAFGLDLDLPSGQTVRLPGPQTHLVSLAEDGVGRVPVGAARVARVSLFDRDEAGVFWAEGLLLNAGSAALRGARPEDLRAVALSDRRPTGRSGAPGAITLAFKPEGGGGYLYLENRTGAPRLAIVTITTVA
ncbi:MAG: hypothetical protein AAFN79_18130 [Pseudomonadota bacterium]